MYISVGREKTQGLDRDTSGRRGEPVCYGCNKPGYVVKDCRKYRPTTVNSVTSNKVKECERVVSTNTAAATVKGSKVTVLYDTAVVTQL